MRISGEGMRNFGNDNINGPYILHIATLSVTMLQCSQSVCHNACVNMPIYHNMANRLSSPIRAICRSISWAGTVAVWRSCNTTTSRNISDGLHNVKLSICLSRLTFIQPSHIGNVTSGIWSEDRLIGEPRSLFEPAQSFRSRCPEAYLPRRSERVFWNLDSVPLGTQSSVSTRRKRIPLV